MMKITFSIALSGIICYFPMSASAAASKTSETISNTNQESIAVFTPPPGWQLADQNSITLPKHVKVMAIGKSASAFPPSINLSSEPYQGTLKQYLEIVKRMNDEKGYDWKDLGIIRTKAGSASLSQVDNKSKWGDIRLMHAIILKNKTIYILTGSALKSEFSQFYKEFFNAMRSFRIATDLYDIIPDNQQKSDLKNAVKKMDEQLNELIGQKQQDNTQAGLKEALEQAFDSSGFQTNVWKPFQEMLSKKYSELGPEWISLMQKQVREELISDNNNYPSDSFKETKVKD